MSERLLTPTGGSEVVARFRDGNTQPVFVRELPVSLLPAYLRAMENEAAMVELVCDKPAGWAETLTRESFLAILEASDDLNAEFCCKCLVRRLQRQRQAIPDLDGHVTRLAQALQIAHKAIPALTDSASAATTSQL